VKPRQLFWVILFLTVWAVVVDLPKNFPIRLRLPGLKIDTVVSSPTIDWQVGSRRFQRDLTIHKGLDLQGGTHLALQADMGDIEAADRTTALESAKEIISRRVDLYGVAEPVIQTSKVNEDYRILVELPGVREVDQVVALIGETAQLDFRTLPEEDKESTTSAYSAPIFRYQSTGLTGRDLKRAAVQFSQESGEPVVALEFTPEGATKFAEITQANLNFPVAIFLDEKPVTAPLVNEVITSGQAVISGRFTTEEANNLTIQLNAGALPVPVKIVEQRTIGPTLGEESVQKSLRAGMIGLLMVIGFMALLYGRLGLIADLGLVIYGLLTLAIYKLIPITLTLPGIAGFILSVGMAVDANILIFERMKEELRTGKKWRAALEAGFGRAWDSIKDANTATIVTALILLNPFDFSWLVSSGMVRGFALTLLIGVLISLFTGVVVTRTLLRVLYKGKE
jgi:preprotein translocase subunit SecD